MKGVQFLVDDRGTKTAAVIDLKHYSELWEDFYDSAVARYRAGNRAPGTRAVTSLGPDQGRVRYEHL